MTKRTPIAKHVIGMPIGRRDLDVWDVPRSRVRAADVSHPFRGVHVVGAVPEALRERCEALVPLLRPDEAFSHTTAAALFGAPLPRARDTRIHVITSEANRMRRPGVVGHRAHSVPLTLYLGLPVVAPAHLFAQLGTVLQHDDLVAVGDFLVTPDRRHRTPGLTDIPALARAIRPGARGAKRARGALADVRSGAESPMETRLRLLLTRAGLPEPLLNPPIRIGDQVLHPDLLYPRWRVAIEYEGEQHRSDERQWRHDIWRREVFEDAGWRQVRVTSDDVLKHPEQLLARICRILAQRQRM